MTTVGDRVLNQSLPKIGEKSLFTKDLEDALRNGGVDFVVHSLKDLPTSLPIGMAIGSVLKREDPRDALVLNEKHKGKTLATLPNGSIIGTSSLRRSAQLARDYKHLIVCDIRGNLNTRLAKLDAPNSKFAGIILAQAGLVRMGWQKRVSQTLEPSEILYAVGQGALAIECRSNDDEILDMLSKLSCPETQCKILVERSFLKTLGGGCSAPVAVCTNLKRLRNNDYQLDIKGAVWSLDGKTKIESDLKCSFDLFTDEENEVTPSKKMKMNDSSNKNDIHRKSPEVIDDSKVAIMKNKSGAGGDQSGLDIEALISIHGEIFKKCPYSLQHQQDKLKKQATSGKDDKCKDEADGCPLQIPIGEDFMGNCPYFDTQQKVDLIDKCPITGKSATDVNENNESSITGACPISRSKRSESMTASTSEKCPFLSGNSVKLIDYVECNENEQPKLIDHSDILFCGMSKHRSLIGNAFDVCQKLGIQLADKLISKGALEVMMAAQAEIRGDQKS